MTFLARAALTPPPSSSVTEVLPGQAVSTAVFIATVEGGSLYLEQWTTPVPSSVINGSNSWQQMSGEGQQF